MANSDTGTVKRGRGRPKGSKNKPKRTGTDGAAETSAVYDNPSVSTAGDAPEKRKTGRPKGRKSSYTVSEKALAQRRAANPFPEKGAGQLAVKPAETDEEKQLNFRLIEHVMKIHEIAAHADRHDLLSLRSCFVAFLKLCQEDGFKVSNLAAYSAMGMSNADFNNFSKKDDPEIRAFCSFVRQTCAMFRETLVSENKINPVIGIFWQRNYDGLRNDTEQVQALQEMDDNFSSGSKSYKEKYKNLIGE